jgi:hypothetical protein
MQATNGTKTSYKRLKGRLQQAQIHTTKGTKAGYKRLNGILQKKKRWTRKD